jgi:hypothetical protein
MSGVDHPDSRGLGDRPAWMDRAAPLREVMFDAAFTIFRSFFLAGDFAGGTPLPAPRLPLVGGNQYLGFALTRDIQGSERELICHYKEVLRLCALHRVERRFAATAIVYDGGEHVAYLDKPSHAIPALLARKEGSLFFDGDQGYAVEVFAFGEQIYLHDYDPDESVDFSTVYFAREPFQAQVEEASRRLEHLTRLLTKEFGKGTWRW